MRIRPLRAEDWESVRARSNGIGGELLKALIEESERNEFWTLQASVFPENVASIALHQRYGFRMVGSRTRIGCLNGVWRDCVLLERRSSVIGSQGIDVTSGAESPY